MFSKQYHVRLQSDMRCEKLDEFFMKEWRATTAEWSGVVSSHVEPFAKHVRDLTEDGVSVALAKALRAHIRDCRGRRANKCRRRCPMLPHAVSGQAEQAVSSRTFLQATWWAMI